MGEERRYKVTGFKGPYMSVTLYHKNILKSRGENKMAIVKPDSMNFANKNVVLIISGLPGTGKTTLALSAPDVLLIDADEGMARVKPEHRKDSSICKTYEEILADINSAEGIYKTIVVDTAGALIDLMKDWAIRTDPKASKSNGSISLQGFGVVKQEFLRLSNDLRRRFNVVFIFHEQMEKNNDDIFYSLVCEGSARTLVYQPADLAAHLFIQNGVRCLGFTPTDQYTAKSAYGIKGVHKVKELADGEPNDYLTNLFEHVKKTLAAQAAEIGEKSKAYDAVMTEGNELISLLDAPEKVEDILSAIKALPHVLTSEKELTAEFKKKVKALNIVYDKTEKVYKYAEN
jgi:hypothetical protein